MRLYLHLNLSKIILDAMDDGKRFRWRRVFFLYVSLTVLTNVLVIAVQEMPLEIPQCPEHEVFKLCLGDCTNCEQRGRCGSNCTQSGCDCVPHFVRLEPGGRCESISKCPAPTCRENEIFRPCGPVCETCGFLRCRILNCEYRCYCKEGYLRDFEGKCIPEDKCPPKTRCSVGEELGQGGPVDEYCLHTDTEDFTNATITKEQCYCKTEYKRNIMGHCTSEDFCPFVRCRNIEKYNPCPPKCNSTCQNYGDPTCEEDEQCFPGCFCPKGYVMNDHRVCVQLEQCPPGSNPMAPTLAPTTPGLHTETSLGDITSLISTTAVTPTSSDEKNTPTFETTSGENLGTTVSDFSTKTTATTQKPKHGKHLNAHHANMNKSSETNKSEPRAEADRNPTKAPKPEPVTAPNSEEQND